MKLIKCECCGSSQLQKHDENSMICSFCGSIYLLDANEEILSNALTNAKIISLFIDAEKCRKSKDFGEEIQILTKAIEFDENNVVSWVKLGRAYRSSNLNEMALECYEKANSINPSYAQAYSNIGAIYLLKKDYHKAVEYYEKALSLISDIESDYPTILANYGIAVAMVGDKKKAASIINSAERKGYKYCAEARKVAGLSVFSKFFFT